MKILGCQRHGHLNCTACADARLLFNLRAELATLKRQHEQLRAAAELARGILVALNIAEWVSDTERHSAITALSAALDATPAEPVRETFDVQRLRSQLAHLVTSDHGCQPSICVACADAARAVERK